MDLLKTLQAINACHGPAGDESEVSEVLEKLAMPFVDECYQDTLGNLIAHKKGSGSRVMFAAHMDSIGCIVTYIEKEGYVRFCKVGGLHATDLIATPVRFKNGVRGVICLSEAVDPKDMTLDDLYIDIGAHDADEAKAMIKIGDTAVYDTPTYAVGDRIVSPYMDNRISCMVLLMAMETLQNSENDLYFVFTSQEEVGLRGSRTAAYTIAPDIAIVVETTTASDLPGVEEGRQVCRLGKGPAVSFMDRSTIYDRELYDLAFRIAKEHYIPCQTKTMIS